MNRSDRERYEEEKRQQQYYDEELKRQAYLEEEDHIIMIEITDENNNCMRKIKKLSVVKKDYHFL
ncbi:hypothetical protein [Staphylococcus saprophyticus]|jgi:hypothetical protein|uniref:hypothetical protein n=1 Tax=Staphylococcus saprophyticus TaxID=29385 RepID=UPI0016433602|nr:hypothetical protein [Staphylococcus saprophyticus]MBC2922063.1 hypothetical protein [Staphylococcus saprophyticus]MBC2958623.1 hypothetical protein [Staphylococcus saprophyticus]MBC3010500.1 hypothetical protein [Staphylococcus saprophyticus]MBC3024383.1 hypothetical protein [Staphylococcus saprophyticus]MBC3031578.1 hypothetical protein [Staphylococcus saprophyticus]